VDVHIDKTRRDDQPGGIERVIRRRIAKVTNGRDLLVSETDVALMRRNVARTIYDCAVLYEEIEAQVVLFLSLVIFVHP
jgi:hypothetical protein